MDSINPNVGRMPVLDATNYQYWKLRMRTFLKSVDQGCWDACLTHYTPPLQTADEQGDKVPLPYAEYNAAQKAAHIANEKALNRIFAWIDTHMFKLIDRKSVV